MGGRWRWRYDGLGNLVKKTDPLGASTEYKYLRGLLHSVTDNQGQTTKLSYEADHQLSRIEYADGLLEMLRYDRLGRCTHFIDVRGIHTHYHYDLLGRKTKELQWEGTNRYMEYDAMDNLVHYKDEHRQVHMRYEGMWKLSSRSENRENVRFRYDTEGQLRSVINEKGETASSSTVKEKSSPRRVSMVSVGSTNVTRPDR
jgi:YD repeat-containing protein